MTIGEVSRQAGVPASTIRYYEKIGLLPNPPRSGGRRLYSPDAIPRLAVVALAQACGFHLDEVRQLLHGFRSGAPPSQRWRKFAAAKHNEIDARMRELTEMRRLLRQVADCRCVDLQECGRRALKANLEACSTYRMD